MVKIGGKLYVPDLQLKNYFLAAVVVACSGSFSLAQSSSIATAAAYDLVNPLIGSSGEGMTSPTAQLPFGMVQWWPDTHIGEWYNYAYEDKKILGFSMTHISGAGCRLWDADGQSRRCARELLSLQERDRASERVIDRRDLSPGH